MLNKDELDQAIDRFLKRKALEHPWLDKPATNVQDLVKFSGYLAEENGQSHKAEQPSKSILNRIRIAF